MDRQAILELHELQRGYHFDKDSVAFIDQLSNEFISVNRGVISTPSKAEMLARYNSYFSTVEFVKWDDMSDPIIHISDDGSMAYTVVDKEVAVLTMNQDSQMVESSTRFAWTAIYRKLEGEWQVECVTSTDR